jgi:hypothetical protein
VQYEAEEDGEGSHRGSYLGYAIEEEEGGEGGGDDADALGSGGEDGGGGGDGTKSAGTKSSVERKGTRYGGSSAVKKSFDQESVQVVDGDRLNACELDDDEGRGAVSPPGMARKSASVLPGVGVTHVTLEVGDGLDSL